ARRVPAGTNSHRLSLSVPRIGGQSKARVAEHDQERMPLAPGEAKLGKVHLGLAARRRLEADSHLLGRLWPHLAYVVAKLRVAARIAQSPDLLQQPDRREGG